MMPSKVPFFSQSHDFTCGPASLMMAIAYFKPGYRTTKGEEIDVWRESTLVESFGTCRYGLALAAWRRGVDVRLEASTKDIVYREMIFEYHKEINVEILDLLHEDLRKKCMEAGIKEDIKEVTVGSIKGSLEKGELPIIMCSTAMFLDEDIPHWIVVNGFDGDVVHVNNPLSDGPETVGLEKFKEHMGSRGNGAMLSLFKRA